MKFKLKVLTPRELYMEENVESVTLPAVDGEATILANHVHILFDMKRGRMLYSTVDEDGNREKKRLDVDHGFAEVANDGSLTVFTSKVFEPPPEA